MGDLLHFCTKTKVKTITYEDIMEENKKLLVESNPDPARVLTNMQNMIVFLKKETKELELEVQNLKVKYDK